MKTAIIFFFSALALAFLLMFIDEGNFSIEARTGSYVFLCIFVLFFMLGQYAVRHILRPYKEIFKVWHGVIIGLPLGMIFYYISIMLFYGLSKIDTLYLKYFTT